MTSTAVTETVLLGAGHAQIEVLRRHALKPYPRHRLTLVTRERYTAYSGMLPALLRAEATHDGSHIDVVRLAAAAGARLILAAAEGIDLAAGHVTVTGQDPVLFDLLSLDVGGVPAAMPGTIAVKPVDGLLGQLTQMQASFPAAARIAVVGSGAGGTELALALARRLAGRVTIALVGAGAEPIAEAPPAVRRAVAAALAEAGVERHDGVAALQHADGVLLLADGSVLPCIAALTATPMVGPAFLGASGLACDAAGCVLVDATLRSVSDPRVFAAGDCAARAGAALPKAGVWAVRAGPVLAENLRRAAVGAPLAEWRPQPTALAILGFGRGRAVAWRGRFSLAGRLPALWKQAIDRRWMRRYQRLGSPAPDLPAPHTVT